MAGADVSAVLVRDPDRPRAFEGWRELVTADPGAVADGLLARFSLTEAASRKVATYSGGMRRRLVIAMSLIGDPPVIFLDEPTTGLDPAARLEVWEAVRELARGGTTVLLTTQYLEEAEQLADRIAILHRGRIIVDGTLEERFTEDPTALLATLTADALARGERLEDLSVTRPSLEDVYLELTEAVA